MTWRSTDSISDKLLGSLPYLMALLDALSVGGALEKLVTNFPVLTPVANVLLLLVYPVQRLYSVIPFGSLVIFFALFFLVVRNSNISHFIRFNTLLSILIGFMITIGLSLIHI